MQWEYLMLSTTDPKQTQRALTAYGEQGWELVSGQYAVLPTTGVPTYMMWLKRPKRNGRQPA